MQSHFNGYVYRERGARRSKCVVRDNEDGTVNVTNDENTTRHSLSSASVSNRIGNIPRWITFNDGVRVETGQHNTLDAILKKHGVKTPGRRVHILESKLRYAGAALVIALGLTFAFVQYALPRVSNYAAHKVPVTFETRLGEQALSLVDSVYFSPSRLDADTQQRLRAHFHELADKMNTPYDYRLEFRKSAIGPNAFALPSGIAVMTDELVELAENDNEIISVLAHELGHLERRHTLRSAIQNSAVVAIIASVTGDLSAVSALAATIPTMLFEAKNSRDFEREADQFAIEVLQDLGIEPYHLANILERMEKSYLEQINEESSDDTDSLFGNYMSSHPATSERMAVIRQASNP